ncbi:polysaccharide deacetylase family protein, partial [Streptomyces lunaelactis]|nr:polysaccharide deacetylase family protein [Streptomyces lunaelactis]
MTSIDRRSALRAGAGAAIAGALASGCTDDGPAPAPPAPPAAPTGP